VVRLLPPLIADETVIAEGIARLDRAATALEQAAARKPAKEAAG
jgi:acetylornithine/succinyldiaminopimelate/putrescine aminotransferase